MPLGDEIGALAPLRSPSGELLAALVDRDEMFIAGQTGEFAEERWVRREGSGGSPPALFPKSFIRSRKLRAALASSLGAA